MKAEILTMNIVTLMEAHNLTPEAENAFMKAMDFAHRNGAIELEPQHLLVGLVQGSDYRIVDFLKRRGITKENVEFDLGFNYAAPENKRKLRKLQKSLEGYSQESLVPSQLLDQLLLKADREARSEAVDPLVNGYVISTLHLLIGMTSVRTGTSFELLREHGVDRVVMRQYADVLSSTI